MKDYVRIEDPRERETLARIHVAVLDERARCERAVYEALARLPVRIEHMEAALQAIRGGRS